MPLDPETVCRRWFEEVWNQGREETIDELFAPEAIAFGLGESEAPIRGPEGFKPFARNMRGAFPDVHIAIEDIMVQGDRAAFRIDFQGTHKGSELGIAPTGRRVHVRGMIMLRVSGGKIVEAHNIWDQHGMLRQIGVVPGPEPEGKDRFFGKV